MCMPRRLEEDLAQAGHDIVHVRNLDPRAPDGWIISRARAEGRIAITMDLDFGEIMAHVRESLPSVILLRLRHPIPDALRERIRQVLRDHRGALESGAIVIVEDRRSRVRRLPISIE
jgi:predicted nuclease of predicted toxin-antitoxin system